MSDEVVAGDYAETNQHLLAIYDFLAKNPALTIDEARKTSPHLMGSPKAAMLTLLATIRAEHGSIRGNLEHQGAASTVFEGLERTLLE